jgi:hypothetical protein
MLRIYSVLLDLVADLVPPVDAQLRVRFDHVLGTLVRLAVA